MKSLKLWLKSIPLSQIRRWNCQIDFSFKSFKSVQSLLIYFFLKRNNEFLRLVSDIQINQNFMWDSTGDFFQSIAHIFVKGDEIRFTIFQPKIIFQIKFEISYFVWSPKILLITFDFSIKPGSICLLEPQDKSEKFTNFESFVIVVVGGGEKYAKTWSLPKANFQVGYIHSTVHWTKCTQTGTLHFALQYTLYAIHCIHYTLYTLYTIYTVHYTLYTLYSIQEYTL